MRVDYDFGSADPVLAFHARNTFDIVNADTGAAITKVLLVDEEEGLIVRPLRHLDGALVVDRATGRVCREEVRCNVRLVPKPGMDEKAAALRALYDPKPPAG